MLTSQSKYDFKINIPQDVLAKGISEDVVKRISASKNEPEWLLEFRLKAYKHWNKLNIEKKLPNWANLKIPLIDFQAISYQAKIKKTTDLVELKKDWIESLQV